MRSLFVFVALASCQVTLGNPVQCGVPQYPVRKTPPNGNRVVGGWEAQAHSLPWTVRLVTFLDDNLTMAAHCGGSLIQMKPGNGTDMVLSASHCFFDPENFAWFPVSRVYALVGIHNHRNKNEQSRRVLKAKSLICDRKFAEVKHAEDIALIQLAEMVPYTDKTRPICLPEKDEELTPGKECFVSGWGVTSETGPGSDVLLMVHVKALENSKCFRQVYRDIVFCAGHLEGGKDACEGDSGGPLFCEVDGKYVQYGIVSQGDGCARRNLPGEYTKLSKFIGWLEDNVKTMQGYDKGPVVKTAKFFCKTGITFHETSSNTD
uniref:limulus clotting factor C n=1 Tax=Trichuris muris TaxID=70415 RepID=A0A5S6QYT2_TRIMR